MDKLPLNTRINIWLHFPVVLPCLIAMKCANSQVGGVIKSDIIRWKKYRNKYVNEKHICKSLIRLLVLERTFRNQFYMRLGFIYHILNILLPQEKSVLLTKQVGSGLCLIHSFATIINGDAVIGDNCTILHSVTIGAGKGGAPTIGDNVYIGAGAIIIGGCHIGNNVKIGAGAIVVTDVPDNSTVVCEKAKIIVRSIK